MLPETDEQARELLIKQCEDDTELKEAILFYYHSDRIINKLSIAEAFETGIASLRFRKHLIYKFYQFELCDDENRIIPTNLYKNNVKESAGCSTVLIF